MSLRNILVPNKNDLFCNKLTAVNTQIIDETVSGTVTYETGSKLNINGDVTFSQTANVTFYSQPIPLTIIPVQYNIAGTVEPTGISIAIEFTRVGQLVIAKIPIFQYQSAAPNIGAGFFQLSLTNIPDQFKPTTASIMQCATVNDDLPSTGFIYCFVQPGGPRFNIYNTSPAQGGNAFFAGTDGLKQGLGTVIGTLGDAGGFVYISYTVA